MYNIDYALLNSSVTRFHIIKNKRELKVPIIDKKQKTSNFFKVLYMLMW
ncbi:hypothetical protein AREALGSMS7_04008 [Arenibacter algicola]|uniref:Uncharacterized protein n=1 Tax=Arenibacter algicola TaxID=616991 RepID=A0A221V1C1_9FLAO|nr:hypothetical protein AREALGSMS7_04008 [Arenibacter algicola]